MDTTCLTDLRRQAVRRTSGRNGLDYVETGDDPVTLVAYFLGKLPPELTSDSPDLPHHLAIDGGEVITGLKILDVDPHVDPDPEHDDYLLIRLDREGDRSRYTLRLVDIEGIDPHYASADFAFRVDCASDLDCKPSCDCAPPTAEEPRPNYLAKDYTSLRQLILDRLALLVPGWRERHVPDLGITLVEVLAYVGDYLSYYQDAVGTEAYLGTARQRISIRRHARLVDYRLHEGCNARAWVQVGVNVDETPPLAWEQLAFVTAWRDDLDDLPRLIAPEQLANAAPSSYEWFEPCVSDAKQTVVFRSAHNEIDFYGWGRRSCCLESGATRATLLDHWTDDGGRILQLQPGDVLVFAEVKGPRTGLKADADPTRRWAVRLTEVTPDEDPLYPIPYGDGEIPQSRPTPVLRIAWSREDALPFPLCLSAIGAAPECTYLDNVTVALGNIVLVDHGRGVHDPLGPVPGASGSACCDCEGEPAEVEMRALPFRPALSAAPLVHAEGAPATTRSASASPKQDPRAASPQLRLVEDDGGAEWTAQPDLLGSGSDDRHLVAEIDNEGLAHLRFGDGELGRRPRAGQTFDARYRVGGGQAGNVGANTISFIVIEGLKLDGVTFTPTNPLPASGGTDPEPIEQAREYAPLAFRRTLRRAITADDYAAIAAMNPALQSAQAALVWTGSWYEADVALDPWQRGLADPALFAAVEAALYRVRRMGHDLRVQRASYVPIELTMHACALPGYERGHVKAALLERFLGKPGGFFDADQLSFGQSVHLSRIVAAAVGVPGVMCVEVLGFHRQGRPPNHEIENGVLPLAPHEIAELANDPNHPERGVLAISVEGGL